MRRRDFLKVSAGAMAAGLLWREAGAASKKAAAAHEVFDEYFLAMLVGFLKNARATSADLVVCDYPEGTKLKSCCTPSGKTYVSVARMLPAMAEWARVKRDTKGLPAEVQPGAVEEILLGIYSKAFDPKRPDFWGYAPNNKPTQLSVEASLVAYALWRLGDSFVERIPSEQRTNINAWLSSCTQVPERTSNHAWFTANNQAMRLELGRKWKEFVGDEAWMIEDLKALDALYKPNNDGWYSDSPDAGVYDYYNFYVFPNFSLYWSQIIGKRYPEWDEKFRGRVKEFLQKTPYFFGADGWHPLYGRSLIYRWTLVTGPIVGYQEGLWPHSAGLLRRMVRKNIECHWDVGAFDADKGKLLETLSPGGTADIRENYIDNGHPYWCMPAFGMLGIPETDAFWTSEEEELPVEKADFAVEFKGPRMRVMGNQRTGEVKWLQAFPAARRETYRDKYMKFVASSAFPFNTLQGKEQVPADQMLVFYDPNAKKWAGRLSCDLGDLTEDGALTEWTAKLGEHAIKVRTRLRILGEFEERVHEIEAPEGAVGIEMMEGSYPMGLGEGEEVASNSIDERMLLRSAKRGALVATWKGRAFDSFEITRSVGEQTRVNLIYPRMAVITMKGRITGPKMTLTSLHYASAKPIEEKLMLEQAKEMMAKW